MKGEQLTMDFIHADKNGIKYDEYDDIADGDYGAVLGFHTKFDLPRPARPRLLDDDVYRFRDGFMQEELDEFREAHANGDLEKAFDSLIDLSYVVIGTAIFMGLPWEEGFAEVHRANMDKVPVQSADESKRGSSYDIVKPDSWRGPDLDRVLREHDHLVSVMEDTVDE